MDAIPPPEPNPFDPPQKTIRKLTRSASVPMPLQTFATSLLGIVASLVAGLISFFVTSVPIMFATSVWVERGKWVADHSFALSFWIGCTAALMAVSGTQRFLLRSRRPPDG